MTEVAHDENGLEGRERDAARVEPALIPGLEHTHTLGRAHRREAPEAPHTARGEEQRALLEDQEERADKDPLAARQRREIAIRIRGQVDLGAAAGHRR
jgi:hypothetical protein